MFECEVSEGFAGCEHECATANRSSRRARGDSEASILCVCEDGGEFFDIFDWGQCGRVCVECRVRLGSLGD